MTRRPKGPGEAAGDRDALLEAFGVRLRETRLKIGMTQEQLAEKVGTSQSYIYTAETGGQKSHAQGPTPSRDSAWFWSSGVAAR